MEISREAYKKLVNGKFRAFQCTTCYGNGWYWVHESGTKRNPAAGESMDDFYKHPCTDDDGCDCLGFRVVFDE